MPLSTMKRSAFFVAPSPLIVSPTHLPALEARRPLCMSGGGNTSSSSSSNGDPFFGRFREFTSPGGDAALQDDLVKEVLWQAQRTATTETMESAIQDELDAVSEMLNDMYSRGERDLRSRHEELARRTSLPNISKWNQTLIETHKMSKMFRSEIDKELAIVDALLRRNRRAQARRKRLSGRSSTKSSQSMQTRQRPALGGLGEALGSASQPAGVFFSAVVCATAMQSFERIAAQPNGPSHLAKYAAMSALLVLMAAHLHAVTTVGAILNNNSNDREAAMKSGSREEKR